MAFGATCDRCGGDLLGCEVRYNVTLEIAQAYDPMEVSSKDLRPDLRQELEAALQSLQTLSPAEVKRMEEEVFSSFRFDLCPACAQLLREDAQAFLRSTRQGASFPTGDAENPPN